jgi:hypothetical protein
MAIACFRLVTLPPRPPLPRFKVPFLRRAIAPFTSRLALREYLAMLASWCLNGPARNARGAVGHRLANSRLACGFHASADFVGNPAGSPQLATRIAVSPSSSA